MKASPVAVVYLARNAEGIASFSRFRDSYTRHAAGLPHKLVVLYKGFDQRAQLNRAREVFSGLAHSGIEISDAEFDIGSYLEACRRLSERHVTFLNTHSEILGSGWLATLHNQVSRAGVGLVGATGSYESIADSVSLFRKVLWECTGSGNYYDQRLAYYYDFILRPRHPNWYTASGEVARPRARHGRGKTKALRAIVRAIRYPAFRTSGTRAIWPGTPSFDHRLFPRFPNPHVRTNAFMVEREVFLAMCRPTVKRKIDASLIESGPDSLTSQLRRKGLLTLLVGRDGEGYAISEWAKSRTFRVDEQDNLLVADNHTRAFLSMSEGARTTHTRITWGDYAGPRPTDFPDMGFIFKQGNL